MPNIIAYNAGAIHFFPETRWTADFAAANLTIERSEKINPFIHCWTLTATARSGL